MIDLNRINEDTPFLKIDGVYDIPKSYYASSDIIDLKNIKLIGDISLKENDDLEEDYYISCNITGTMIIPDSISLDSIDYDFSIYYDDFLPESCKKSDNTLDILEFLWENIALEVPLKFTKESDLSKYHGDGWKLVSEDELKTNNPFNDLLKDFEEEWYYDEVRYSIIRCSIS